MVYNEKTPDAFQVIANLEKPRSETCNDFFLFGNTEIYHVEDFMMRGKHVLNFKASGEAAIEDVKVNGLETYLFCEDLKDELLSVFTTVKAFVGGLGLNGKIPIFGPKVPEYMEKANIEFLKWAINYDMEVRTTQKVVIDESLI